MAGDMTTITTPRGRRTSVVASVIETKVSAGEEPDMTTATDSYLFKAQQEIAR
jgi:hypothetical protein